jgi:hypothetical protein
MSGVSPFFANSMAGRGLPRMPVRRATDYHASRCNVFFQKYVSVF